MKKKKQIEILGNMVGSWYVNHDESSLEDIRRYEIQRVEMIIEEFETETLLCSNMGESIVAEFGFKGNLQEVNDQLAARLEYYKTNELTESDRTLLIYESIKRRHHQEQSKLNGYNIKMNEAVKSADISEMTKYRDMKIKKREEMHRKKECLCYSNLIA